MTIMPADTGDFPMRCALLLLSLLPIVLVQARATICRADRVTQIIDSSGDGVHGLVLPVAIAADPSGTAYVAGQLTNNAFEISPGGTISQIIDASGDGTNALYVSNAIAADPLGNVYVGGDVSSNVFKIAPDGTTTQIIDSGSDGVGLFTGATSIAADSAGNVYVASSGSDNAFKITPGGTITQIIDASGDGVNGLDTPTGIAVDSEGSAYVSGSRSDNAFKISSNGTITQIIDASGDGMTGLDMPTAIAVDTAGNAYVSASGSHNAFKVTPSGIVTPIIDASGDGSNDLDSPSSIAAGPAGNVYVAGRVSNNAFQITPSGIITQVIDASGDGVAGLAAPADITVDSAGKIYVAGHTSYNAFTIELEVCTDGIDNDGDGEPDSTDPDCQIDYVSLGDSYSSGEGASPDTLYILGTDCAFCDGGNKNRCHRSMNAYGFNVLPISDVSAPVSLQQDALLACSGATVENILSANSTPIAGVPPDTAPNEAPQLDKVFDSEPLETVANEATDMVTLTVGGNDIGFRAIALNCYGGDCTTGGLFTLGDLGRTAQAIAGENLPALASSVALLLNRVRDQVSSTTAIFLIGYPHLFAVDSGQGECENMNEAERITVRSIVEDLNAELRTAAQIADVHFVDPNDPNGDGEPTDSPFMGGELCNSGSLFNGYMPGPPNIAQQSFHPNVAGHLAYAVALDAYIEHAIDAGCFRNNLGIPLNDASCLGGAEMDTRAFERRTAPAVPPKQYGRLSIEPGSSQSCDTNGRYAPGALIRIAGNGFMTSSTVEIRMGNEGESFAVVIGDVAADVNGNVDHTFEIPENFPAGSLGMVGAIGNAPSGADRAAFGSLNVVPSVTADGDGDTIPDACDNCIADSNSTQADADGDGIGDACDACVDDPENDIDADGTCAGADICPHDPENDLDSDGLCAHIDGDDDGDGLDDWQETGTGVFIDYRNTGTDAENPDTDGDGFRDGAEVLAGSNPLDPTSRPEPIRSLSWPQLLMLLSLLAATSVTSLRQATTVARCDRRSAAP